MPTPTLAPVTVYGTWPPDPSGWGGAGGMWDWDLYSRPEWDWLMGWDWGDGDTRSKTPTRPARSLISLWLLRNRRRRLRPRRL